MTDRISIYVFLVLFLMIAQAILYKLENKLEALGDRRPPWPRHWQAATMLPCFARHMFPHVMRFLLP